MPASRDTAPSCGPARAGLAYHRLELSDPRHRWWMPLLEIPLAAFLFLVLGIGLGLLMSGFLPAGPLRLTVSGYPVDLFTSPARFTATFLGIAVMLPAVLGARLVLGPRPLGLIASVAGRMRWGWLGLCCGIGVVLFAALQLLLAALPALAGADAVDWSVRWDPATSWTLLVLILVLVPLQCAAEEFAFRGLPMQTVGRWLRHPAWAILLPVPFFILGHGYDAWGQASVGFLAVVSAWLAWATGGLEAGIGLHVANNLVGMVLGLLGWADPLASSGGSAADLALAVVLDGAYAVVVLLLARRHGLATRRPAAPTALSASTLPAPRKESPS